MQENSEIVQRLFAAENELDRFDILAMAALGAPKYPPEMKDDAHRVNSCETKTWFCADTSDGLKFYAVSDSLFIGGLCEALIETSQKLSPPVYHIGFADECFARGIITARRRDGLYEIEKKIIKYINQRENKNEKGN